MSNTNLLNEQDDESSLENQNKEDDFITIPKSKIIIMKKLLENIATSASQLSAFFDGMVSSDDEERIGIGQAGIDMLGADKDDELKIIEGVFDGENMIGPDGKVYSVPANYASKSKLVEGDIMKLTITNRGTFVYKQIGPIDRSRYVGILEKNNEGDFHVNSEGKKWRVLTASVTYFKGSMGDETVILVPKNGTSKWAAIENIIHTLK